MTRQEQIEEVLAILTIYWLSRPELRLGQIISNMSDTDPFHLNDVKLNDRLLVQIATGGCRHPGCYRGSMCTICGTVAR